MAGNLLSPANDVLQVHAAEQDSDFEIDFINDEPMEIDTEPNRDIQRMQEDEQSDLEEGEIRENTTARKKKTKNVSFDLDMIEGNKSVYPRSNGLFFAPYFPKTPSYSGSAWMKSSPIDFTKSERLKKNFDSKALPPILEQGIDEIDRKTEMTECNKPQVFKISNELQLDWLSKKYDPPVKCETVDSGPAQPAHEKPGGTLPILIQLMSPKIKIPSRAYPGSAGYDVFSPVNVVIPPKQRRKINLRFKVKMPTGWYLEMKQRSSVSIHKRIKLEGQPCTIDSDYRGWIFIFLSNHGFEPYQILEGDKLVQLIPHRVPKIVWFTCDSISAEGDVGQRGVGGFGSSGR